MKAIDEVLVEGLTWWKIMALVAVAIGSFSPTILYAFRNEEEYQSSHEDQIPTQGGLPASPVLYPSPSVSDLPALELDNGLETQYHHQQIEMVNMHWMFQPTPKIYKGELKTPILEEDEYIEQENDGNEADDVQVNIGEVRRLQRRESACERCVVL